MVPDFAARYDGRDRGQRCGVAFGAWRFDGFVMMVSRGQRCSPAAMHWPRPLDVYADGGAIH
jgi:hypothetical protein